MEHLECMYIRETALLQCMNVHMDDNPGEILSSAVRDVTSSFGSPSALWLRQAGTSVLPLPFFIL